MINMMWRYPVLVLILMLFISQISFSQNVDPGFETISTTEFYNLTNKKKTILLDVRTPEEFQKNHLKGAINLNYNNPEFKNLIQGLDKNKMVLVYCASGRRSAKSCEILKEANFKNIYNLEGGINAWIKENLPVEALAE